MLNQLNHRTTLASKATRCVLAAAGHPVVDFSLRRTHGTRSGFEAARAGAMAGFAAPATWPPPPPSASPPSARWPTYIEAFPTEEDAFRAFARPPRPGDLPGGHLRHRGGRAHRGTCGTSAPRCTTPVRRFGSTAATSAPSHDAPGPCSTTRTCPAYGSPRAEAWTSTRSRNSSAPAPRSTPTPSAPVSACRPTRPTWTPPTRWSSTTAVR
ncbi:hypothetical protein ACFQV4_27280 [Streptomyces thermocarboxydus]